MSLPFGPTLRQPDQTSCGAACVVAARLLRASAGPGGGWARTIGAAFADEVLEMHRLLVRPVDPWGRAQLPWPAALGTPPWAVARALGAIEGVPYRTRIARWSREVAYSRVVTGVTARPVALYVGSALLPRHVVLALSASAESLTIYDPASGGLAAVTRSAFLAGSLSVAGWDAPWFAVLPSTSGR